jgi:twinkle protein
MELRFSTRWSANAERQELRGEKFSYLEADEARLKQVKKFVLAVDADPPGQKLEAELARRLGWQVSWPHGCKDANDVLFKLGKDTLRALYEGAKPYPVEGVIEVADIADRIRAIYDQGLPEPASTGFRRLDGLYRVRPGEFTVLTGIPSHGKSEFLDALMINLGQAGWRFGVYSAENLPLELRRKVYRQTVWRWSLATH